MAWRFPLCVMLPAVAAQRHLDDGQVETHR